MKVEAQEFVTQNVDSQHAGTRPSKDGRAPQETVRKKPTFLRTMLSVFQASFGVQSDANRERDFENGSITGFVVAAVIFTVVFVLALVMIVSLVLP